MARTAEKVRELVGEDPDLRDVLADLVESEDELRWRDVKGDLTSGQWGRLLQKDILVEGDDGFRFADPSGVREGSESASGEELSTAPEDVDDEETLWSTYDKAAAVATVGLFAGYSFGPVRNIIGSVMDVFLGPLDAILPFYAVIVLLAVLTGLYSTILQTDLMNMDKMGAYQERMKDIQDRQKAAKERGDDEALDRIREEQMDAMGDQLGMFKEQFRPMVWIMLITIPVFLWMYWKILPGAAGQIVGTEPDRIVMPILGSVESWRTGVIGPLQAWILWYILASISFSQIIRKALNIQTTPTS
ncbi:DUF106 domain-containing protein [Halanaeroarchaeum sulfurireducens]|uniref:HTR-like protein n=1 Tax=Halanaeroarchaeum sulfurireducens TaxID=1604004 RepID=A0A0N9NC88_9EURY|nr:DUF106 domain-containing protein [Halanaeroarchaeum sulfurireducens]ALG82628.1 HTR-like protein [Halanaeroarchaeum sulfurireducens]